jgi:acyl-CoA dehydrogenase
LSGWRRSFALAVETEPIAKKLRDAGIRDWRAAEKSGLITEIEGKRMAAQEEAAAKVIAVDHFAADALSPVSKKPAPDVAATGSRTQQSAAGG